MEEPLNLKHNLSRGRYVITKVLSSDANGAIYYAKDKEYSKEESCVIRELYMSPNVDEAKRQELDERFHNSMLIISQFEHANLAKIYDSFVEKGRYYAVMERVDGVTLRTLLGMSVKPLPEKQVLGWALQICKAMQYLHDRPKPFIFDALVPSNIMIDQDENIRLINFGLSRFFVDEEAVSFSSSPARISQEIKQMARTLAFLLTRQELNETGFSTDLEISESLVKLINRLLTDDNGGINDFNKLYQELENIKNPPKKAKAAPRSNQPDFKLIDFNRSLGDLVERFMKQPIWLIGSEALALIVAIVFIYMTLNPPVNARTEAAAYIACGNELHAYSALTKAPLGKAKIGHSLNCLAPSRDGIKLYCSLRDSGHIAVFNAQSNRLIGTFPVGNGSSKMVMDPAENWLYVLSTSGGMVTSVAVSHEDLPETSQQNAIKEKATGMYSVGTGALGLAIYKKAPPSAKEAQATPEGPDDVVLCSSSTSNTLDAFTNPPMTSLNSQYCKSAGPIAVTKDGKTAVVGQVGIAQLEFFRTSDLKSQGLTPETGGSDLRQVLIDPSQKEVWCVNGSGTLGVISLQTKKPVGQVKLEGKPIDAVWNTLGSKPELWVVTANPDKLAIVDPSTKVVQRSITLGGTPSDICLINAPSK